MILKEYQTTVEKAVSLVLFFCTQMLVVPCGKLVYKFVDKIKLNLTILLLISQIICCSINDARNFLVPYYLV